MVSKIIKVDSNYNLGWPQFIRSEELLSAGQYQFQFGLCTTFDSSYVVAGGFKHPVINFQKSAQLTKISDFGNVLWQRNLYLLVYDSLLNNNAPVVINDVIQTADSGCVMVGSMLDTHLVLHNKKDLL